MKKIFLVLLMFYLFSFALSQISGFVPGEIILQFSPESRLSLERGLNNQLTIKEGIVLTGLPNVDRLNQLYRVIAARPVVRRVDAKVERFNLDLIYSFLFADKGIDVEKIVKEYASLPEIEYALPNLLIPVDRIPNDPRFSSQWHLSKMMCPEAWDFSTGDTTVTVAVIDQGIDYGHQDLMGSFWVNRAEDINNNGRLDTLPPPEGDLDGIDQDNNGYSDDVIGYDFVGVDPNPMPEGQDNHGTICHGIACARTDNGIGVASVGWSVRGMNLRCGAGGYIYLTQAIAGIIYAAQMGVFAISNSYGGTSFYPPLNNAIQYAWAQGCVISASAGNTYSGGMPYYPACYDNVIATAASDRNDWHSVWGGGQQSNYADWVDVAAPGSAVLTTTNNQGYGAYDGTSMSSPCVAGQAALLKSAFPSLTNDQCTTKIFLTCDTMPDTLYHQGLLGHGRINVGKAIFSFLWCNLTVVNFRINDAAGNNNGVPEPGEVCGLIVTLKNQAGWQDAENITATISSSNPFMEILKSSAGFPNIPAGSSGDCSADSFVIRFRSNSPPQRVKFLLSLTSTPRSFSLTDNITVTCGNPRIILVDDDEGQNYEKWYKAACDSLSVLYKLWENVRQGVPPSDTLRNYPVVIWWTGLDSTTCLTSEERTVLQNYLDNRGNLFITGANIGQSIGNEPFYQNYLRASYLSNHSGGIYVYGVSGDPIGVGDSIVVGGAGGANNGRTNDVISPVNGGIATHYYRGAPSSYAGIRYEGTYKLVYFGFPFEAANHTARYVQKPELLRRILLYFGEQLPYGLEEKVIARSAPWSLKISPNPLFVNRFLVQYPGSQLKIYSVAGRLLSHPNLSGRIKPGVYFLELLRPEGLVRIKAVIVN